MDGVVTKCDPNPDVAGPGIVWSFTTSATLIVLASYGIIIHRVFARHHDYELCFCNVLEKTVSSLGQTQIATGWALLICVFCTYSRPWIDLHAWLAVYLSALCIFSTSATHTMLVAKDDWQPRHLRPRGIVISIYMTTLFWSCLHQIRSVTDDQDVRYEYMEWSHSFPLVMYLNLTSIHAFVMAVAMKGDKHNTQVGIALLAIFGLVATIHMLWSVLHLKHGNHDGCKLNTGEDNEWKLGQLLAMIMLIAPLMTTFEALREGSSRHDRHDLAKEDDIPLLGTQHESTGHSTSMTAETDDDGFSQPSRRTTLTVEEGRSELELEFE